MSDPFQTTAPQQSPADQATAQAIDAVITKAPAAQTEAAFNRATIEHRRSAPADDGSQPSDTWRDGSDAQPLPQMPAAPTVAQAEVTAAITKLNERSGGHSDLVARWGPNFTENFAYARSAFADIAANRPDMIEKFQASGLGDDPSVIEHLAQFGRQNAGRLGDFTIARSHNNNGPAPTPSPNYTPVSSVRSGPSGHSDNNGSAETRGELNRLLEANPPGSMGYKANASRIQQLYGMLNGTGAIIGRGGRTS